jgi:dephospho-CoA kinase
VVSAPREVQMQRVLARAGMTAERFAQIEALQTSDAEKRAQATVVIPTGLGLETSMRYLKEAVEQSKNKTGSVYPLHCS